VRLIAFALIIVLPSASEEYIAHPGGLPPMNVVDKERGY
jgi:hypothetical protein